MSYRPAPAQYRRCSPPSWPASRSGLSVGLLRRDSAERRLQPSRVIGGDGVRHEGVVHKASTSRSARTDGGRAAVGLPTGRAPCRERVCQPVLISEVAAYLQTHYYHSSDDLPLRTP